MKKLLLSIAVVSACCMACSIALAPAPSPTLDCNSELTELVPCLGFVQGTDKSVIPTCCKGFSSVVKTSPACLCTLLLGGAAGSAGVNLTLAFELPAKCGIHTSLSNCSVSSPGGAAPAPEAGGGRSPPHPPNSAFIYAPTIRITLAAAGVCLMLLLNKIT